MHHSAEIYLNRIAPQVRSLNGTIAANFQQAADRRKPVLLKSFITLKNPDLSRGGVVNRLFCKQARTHAV
ncbi:hypothetical protein J4Q44_G00135040 [Coregonus suidteri]|uniref:Uncharacterized protein n=1 Tax=Coregonus suidteri TaxID=861788 RepID=A0AAN8QTH3_9TELE